MLSSEIPGNPFQALTDPSRLRVVRLLAASDDEACLCELVDCFAEPEYKLSRQMKILREAGLVSSEKVGRRVYHYLRAKPMSLMHLYAYVLALPDTDGSFAADLARFNARHRLPDAERCHLTRSRRQGSVLEAP